MKPFLPPVLALVALSLLPMSLAAQTQAPDPATRLEQARAEVEARHLHQALGSPRDTMQTFLQAMTDLARDPEAWDRAVQCLDVGTLPGSEARARARDLYGILNRLELVDSSRLPDAAEAASLSRLRFFPAERHRAFVRRIGRPAGEIVLRPDASGLWRFDARTVKQLPALFAQVKPLPLVAGRKILTVADWLEAQLPESLVKHRFLGVKYWQWFGLFAVIVLGLLVDLGVRLLLAVLSRRVATRLHAEHDPEDLRRTLRPLGLAAAALVWLMALNFVELYGTVELVLASALRIFLVLAGTLAAWRLIDLVASVAMARAERTDSRVDDILVRLLTRAFKVFVVTIGFIYGAGALDIPIAPLLASLTVAGVGFSFAAKDTVENFFGSVAVILDRPFDIGDWVVIGETEGIVEQVGFRSTRIRTFYNSQITVPNSNLVRATVDNYGRRRYRRWRTTLGLQYDTPPHKLLAFTEGVRELVRSHPYTRKDYYQVWCHEFGASSLDVMLYLFFEVPDWNTELRERERLFLDIVRLADQLGVQFAFPTQTLHVFPGKAPGQPAALPQRDAVTQASLEGIRAAHGLVREQPWRAQRPGPEQVRQGVTELPLDDAGNPIARPGQEPGSPEEGTSSEET